MNKKMDKKVVETIRFLSADAVQKANSGHPGLPMGTATMAYTLWSRHMKASATDSKWYDRDRFVLSAGHGSMLLYSLLYLFGYEVTLEDIKNFRQWGSKTPGHPEYGMTQGVETTTGPLGQGISNAVGMAIAERRLAAEFNTNDFQIVDHYTYALVGDGDLMEGVSAEASSLAGHLKLGKLIALYDDNSITIDGSTDISFTEDVKKRYEAYGWEVIVVDDGNNPELVSNAISAARINTIMPTMIICKTIIGYGSPNKAGKSDAHGSPLGNDEIRLAKKNFGWDEDLEFNVPDDVLDYMKEIIDAREIERFLWEERFSEYCEKYPHLAKKWNQWHEYEIDDKTFDDDNLWNSFKGDDASRSSGGKFMNLVKDKFPNLIGGSADLNGSTKTYLKGFGDFSFEDYSGNNIFFGVREHAMGSIVNGISVHGGFRTFASTFLVFSDYMKPAIRLSALMKQSVIYVFTHDSIGVGEDGPTHQPIEHLLMLRSIPNVHVFRPADAKETAICWIEALKRTDGPSVIVLSRQTLPRLEGVGSKAHKGGYILEKESKEKPDAILMGTGSEVYALVQARKILLEENIDVRVVSLPCVEAFRNQSDAYKEEVLPSDVYIRLSLEAGVTYGWHEFVGMRGKTLGIDHFGESAPGDRLMEEFGFTAKRVADEVRVMLEV